MHGDDQVLDSNFFEPEINYISDLFPMDDTCSEFSMINQHEMSIEANYAVLRDATDENVFTSMPSVVSNINTENRCPPLPADMVEVAKLAARPTSRSAKPRDTASVRGTARNSRGGRPASVRKQTTTRPTHEINRVFASDSPRAYFTPTVTSSEKSHIGDSAAMMFTFSVGKKNYRGRK